MRSSPARQFRLGGVAGLRIADVHPVAVKDAAVQSSRGGGPAPEAAQRKGSVGAPGDIVGPADVDAHIGERRLGGLAAEGQASVISEEEIAAALEADRTFASREKKRRILVVDDNKDSAASLSKMLELTGNEVRTAHDGLQAVEAARTFQPEVVLLDIGLPKLNGYDAARRIRALPGGQSMFLIALTGWGQDEDKRRSAEAGFNLHLVKPMDPAALENLLAGLHSA